MCGGRRSAHSGKMTDRRASRAVYPAGEQTKLIPLGLPWASLESNTKSHRQDSRQVTFSSGTKNLVQDLDGPKMAVLESS